jgi:ppGpp synthetase/RelA/SpoT-type nucleotidyltranferase
MPSDTSRPEGESLSRSTVDRLGDRLRDSDRITTEDRVLLDTYRRSLRSFSKNITERLQSILSYAITERPGKTTPSIIAKLKRQPISLSRMQDIAGGRVVVPNIAKQDEAVKKVTAVFPDARVVDRRVNPMVGYHAVHVIVRTRSQSYELQVRTTAQQRWAQLSEKIADLVGFEIKYGGGSGDLRRLLELTGKIIYLSESVDEHIRKIVATEDAIAKYQADYVKTYPPERIREERASNQADLEEELQRLEYVIQILEGAG